MIRTKCILDPAEDSDELRLSVMSSHEWKEGLVGYTDVTRIDRGMYDSWMRCFAPSCEDVVGYYKGDISWGVFAGRYASSIATPDVQILISSLSKIALKSDFTFLCLEKSPDYCHRRLLAEEFKRHESGLILDIR